MNTNERDGALLAQFSAEVKSEYTGDILAFYMERAIDKSSGGFYGYIADDLKVRKRAAKALIQNTRILWTYAQASRVLVDDAGYVNTATAAYQYLTRCFWDEQHGGLYWMLDHHGRPTATIKMVYGQAFGIYAFAEYYLATGSPDALVYAQRLFDALETHAVEPVYDGYSEACDRRWRLEPTIAVDTVKHAVAKSMNTHLHVLEAYTNLLRAWPDPRLRARLRALIRMTIDHLVDPVTAHFRLHFDESWRPLNDHVSYGHDIEGSWLLVEAAEVLGDRTLLAETNAVAVRMATATLVEGVDTDGGLFNEGNPTGVTDRSKDWWPQAEAMVGFLNAFQISGERRFLDASLAAWQFVQNSLIDRSPPGGAREWFWGVDAKGRTVERGKTGPWKGPYHNGRACVEIMRRTQMLLDAGAH